MNDEKSLSTILLNVRISYNDRISLFGLNFGIRFLDILVLICFNFNVQPEACRRFLMAQFNSKDEENKLVNYNKGGQDLGIGV